jgi:hypothetical protein
MSKHGYTPGGLLRRLGVAAAAQTDAGEGTNAPEIASRTGRTGSLFPRPLHRTALVGHKIKAATILIGAMMAMICVGFLTPGASLANTGYGFSGAFGSQGPAAGQFEDPSGVAVNDATTGPNAGDVYVVDKGNKRVEEFSAAGAFVKEFAPPGGFVDPEAIAVDNSGSASDHSKEDVYVTDTGSKAVDKFEADGKYVNNEITAGSSEELLGVAVDPNGKVWVYTGNVEEQGTGEIDGYSDAEPNVSAGHLHSEAGGVPKPGLAVDAAGNFYVGHRGVHKVAKLNSLGVVVNEELGGENSTAFAVNPSNNDVYINRQSALVFGNTAPGVEVFSPAEGPPVDTFGPPRHPVSGAGIAVSATGAAYVADSAENDVDIFVEGQAPETPLTEAAKEITATKAVLHGELNPNVEATAGWYFAYKLGSECTGGEKTPEEPEAKVLKGKESKEVTRLEPNAQYTFCFVAENAFGETSGLPETLQTSAAPPTVLAGSEHTSGVTSTAATLEAQVNPNNEETKYTFEYSTTESGGELTGTIVEVPSSPGILQAEFAEPTVSAPTEALTPGTTYYYRVVAENAQSEIELKPVVGAVTKFATVATPHTEPVTLVGTTTATFNGTLTPLNKEVPTEYAFEYNVEEEPVCTGESSTARESAGTSPMPTTAAVSIPVTGLQPNRKYSVCLVSLNEFGGSEVASPPLYFETKPAPPKVEAEAFSEVTSSGARLEASVNANNQEVTKCEFQYGTDASLATSTPVPCEQATLAGVYGGQGADVDATGLAPGTTYYYRVVATNATGSTEQTATIEHFTTQGTPLVSTGEAQSVTRTTATFSGTVDPVGAATTYYFAYISEAGYQAALAKGAPNPYAEGEATAPLSAGSSYTTQAVGPIPAGGMLPGKTYYYALIARNEVGVTIGAPEIVKTLPGTPPTVSTGGVSGVSQNAATLTGTVGTNSLQTEYGFEIGTEPSNYGPATGLGSIGGATAQGVSVALGELQPGTTYYYRITARNADGTSYGEPVAFATPGFPTLFTVPTSPPLLPAAAIVPPPPAKATTIAPPKTVKCKQGYTKKNNKCVKNKKKKTKAKKASHNGRGK